jgi:hypothetical protein
MLQHNRHDSRRSHHVTLVASGVMLKHNLRGLPGRGGAWSNILGKDGGALMAATAQEVFMRDVRNLPLSERLRLAALILHDLTQPGVAVVEQGDAWSEEDQQELTAFSLEHAGRLYPEDEGIV